MANRFNFKQTDGDLVVRAHTLESAAMQAAVAAADAKRDWLRFERITVDGKAWSVQQTIEVDRVIGRTFEVVTENERADGRMHENNRFRFIVGEKVEVPS